MVSLLLQSLDALAAAARRPSGRSHPRIFCRSEVVVRPERREAGRHEQAIAQCWT
jgi:hypothetical protein